MLAMVVMITIVVVSSGSRNSNGDQVLAERTEPLNVAQPNSMLVYNPVEQTLQAPLTCLALCPILWTGFLWRNRVG